MTYTRAFLLEAARIEALTAAGHAAWHAKVVASSQLQSLRQSADWWAICTLNGAHEDGAGYVQDHAKHGSSILTRRNPTHGGYERNRSPAKSFSSDEQARRDQL